ncbi:MAG: type IV pilus modification protein PilV [Granulosicoccaceae bacterium]
MIRRERQSGVTLIEVLITLVILGIALSGIAAMQLSSMQSATQMKYHSAATAIAQSMLDSMRAGRSGATAADSLANLQSYIGSNTSSPPAATQAGQDYIAFIAELNAAFTNRSPGFTIAVDANRMVTVSITWSQRDDNSPANVANKTYSVSSIL